MDMLEINKGVIADFRANGGKVGGQLEGLPVMLLTMTGAKSGRELCSPLVYSMDGDDMVVIASKGGAPDHPNWYHNLVANPDVTVEIGTEKFEATAVLTVTNAPTAETLVQNFATVRWTTAQPASVTVTAGSWDPASSKWILTDMAPGASATLTITFPRLVEDVTVTSTIESAEAPWLLEETVVLVAPSSPELGLSLEANQTTFTSPGVVAGALRAPGTWPGRGSIRGKFPK